MAIFGQFSEMPVLDVLTVAARGFGIFHAREFTGGNLFEAHFKPGLLVHAETDGRPHTSEQEAAEALATLLRSKEGNFEMHRVEAAAIRMALEFHFDALLLLAAKGLDESGASTPMEEELPT